MAARGWPRFEPTLRPSISNLFNLIVVVIFQATVTHRGSCSQRPFNRARWSSTYTPEWQEFFCINQNSEALRTLSVGGRIALECPARLLFSGHSGKRHAEHPPRSDHLPRWQFDYGGFHSQVLFV